MEPFIRVDQFHYIKDCTQKLIHAHASINDRDVLDAYKSLTLEKVTNLFVELETEKKLLLHPILDMENKEQAEEFLGKVKLYVIPFKEVTLQTAKKLLPKVKKLKLPSLDHADLLELSYLGIDDQGSQKKYLIAYLNGKPIGVPGQFNPINKKGICAVCNKLEEVGLFLTEKKGTIQGTFTKKGNYICQNSHKCNQNLTSLEKLNDFLLLCLK
ncbi:FusB/FusC family EF-G-binding protein [Neobacillus mesonae]|uniref:Elongation factor G-binding protein n=1 Tax=Neobacillus mesonae TaxID=1193713 RepID=A0A3T0I070_9BACI|nr:FusB/FusC family EF-G-binding protein [Neobacillus mesonae]AZU62687.1 elongation factor G-binding protein [Neobacillus mesonae]